MCPQRSINVFSVLFFILLDSLSAGRRIIHSGDTSVCCVHFCRKNIKFSEIIRETVGDLLCVSARMCVCCWWWCDCVCYKWISSIRSSSYIRFDTCDRARAHTHTVCVTEEMSLHRIQGAYATLRRHHRWHWKRKYRHAFECGCTAWVNVKNDYCYWHSEYYKNDIVWIYRYATVRPSIENTKMISFQLCITESASLFIVVLSIEQVFFGAQNCDFTWKFNRFYWIGPFCWIESEEHNDELPRNLVEWCWIVFEMLE